VGVKNLRYPLVVRNKNNGVQHTVAQVDLYVDLPDMFKGTHMSRFDALCDERCYQTRSEAIRDLIRKELVHKEWENQNQEVTGTLTPGGDRDPDPGL